MRPIPFERVRRATPKQETLDWRENYLRGLQTLRVDGQLEVGEPSGLEPGNKKVGREGGKFASGYVWNLPSVLTCPGASEWCMRCCYNADSRADVFPVDKWLNNLRWYKFAAGTLEEIIKRQLEASLKPAAVRIHSSGDFFDATYVEFWRRIVSASSDTLFWAYTRSWVVPSIRPALEVLRREGNVQLFASVDPTMSPPPAGWRQSFVIDAPEAYSGPGYGCPEQVGDAKNCLECEYCFSKRNGHVVFSLH